jgi:hypothetical protein
MSLKAHGAILDAPCGGTELFFGCGKSLSKRLQRWVSRMANLQQNDHCREHDESKERNAGEH